MQSFDFFFFTAATVIAIFFSTSYIKNHRRRLFQKKSRHQPSATCHYIADTRCLTSATLERYVRRETSVTVPSRLNAPIVLWWLNNLTLPSLVSLKLSTWQLESVARLISTSLTMAVYCPLHCQFRSFKIGILAMWMMENARFYQNNCFWWNCLHVANVMEYIATESRAEYCHLSVKLTLIKRN